MAVAPEDEVDPLSERLAIQGDAASQAESERQVPTEEPAAASDPVLQEPPVPEIPKAIKNYEMRQEMFREIPEDTSKLDKDINVPGMSDRAATVRNMIESVRYKIDPSEETESWITTLMDAFATTPGQGLFVERLDNPDSFWRQSLDHNNSRVGGIAKPRLGGTSGTRMSHEKQILSIRSKLGMGTPINTTLFSSGISATSKPLHEREIVAVWTEIFDQTLTLGRRTHGALFSNSQVYADRAIYRFWLNSIVSTSVKDLKLDSLLDIISISDMPSISHAVATSIYPNGIPYQRAAWTPEGMPKQEIRQLLDLGKVMWFDEKMLDKAQMDHLAKRDENSTTLEQVKKYQDSLVYNRTDIIDIGNGIKVHLVNPTLRQYFETGDRWIMELNRIVKEALGDDATDMQRNKYVEMLSKASRLCKYAHYVKGVENDGEMTDTGVGISQLLEALSGADWVANKFYTGVHAFQNASQIAIAATTSVNEYEDEMTKGTRFPRLIPFDTTSTFFLLVEQKLRGIVSRDAEDI